MLTQHDIQYEMHSKPVQEIFNLYDNDQLNLEPGFQRKSVWSLTDRRRLIESMVRGYPLPTIFLYQRQHGGDVVYDVIDGKQRIESLLMFANKMHGKRFEASVQLPGEDAADFVSWKALVKQQRQHLLTAYKLQCVEVRGGLADIIDLFVRINSTGKALTSAEKNHARYFNSPFLVAAEKLARKFHDYFVQNRIITPVQVQRMKHVELVCELMLAAHTGDVTHKKTALDKVMQSGSMTPTMAAKASDRTQRALKRTLKILPKLRQTRFAQLADFYSLATLVGRFDRDGLILSDRHRNALAADLLTAFSIGVDMVKVKQKKAQGPRPNEEQYRQYLLTVLEGTDSLQHRQQRGGLLHGLLASLFEAKDKDRAFSPEQRRVLWNSTASKKCTAAGCNRTLTWDDFTIDHIKPWNKGGRTALDNAALMCQKHNSAKGSR